MSTTIDERRRIRERVWPVVLDYCRTHNTFFSRELDEFVETKIGRLAPDTAARRLGELRQKGYLDYWVDSDHRFHMLREPQPDLQVEFNFDDEPQGDE